MSNIYWPVYKNLESEVTKLTFSIHIDDHQLDVYSSFISDLILRASAELESISKELYKINGGKKIKNVRYDTDAIKHLNSLWKLEDKIVLISSINCFQTTKEIKPFLKNEISTFHGKNTFSWNNAYQNLKHDRGNSLPFGSIRYLFEIMAALFILNLYYKDESFHLKNHSESMNLPINIGSEIFAVKIHRIISYDKNYNYGKSPDFNECLYLIKYTNKSLEENKKATEQMIKRHHRIFLKHPKFKKFILSNDILNYKGNNLFFDVLGKEEYFKVIRNILPEEISVMQDTEYEAVLNRNNI